MNTTIDDDKDQRLKGLLAIGADAVGGSVGAVVGFFFGGLAGATIGSATGVAAAATLKRVGADISNRFLSPREERRIGSLLALVAQEVSERVGRGESPRTDGLFDADSQGHVEMDEVAEAVILKCQREPEERKLPYFAHLLAAVAFDSRVTPEYAQQLVKLGERLTFRQLCLLRIAATKGSFALREADYRKREEGFTRELYSVLQECVGLHREGLVNCGGEVVFGLTDINPGAMTIQGVGTDIHNLMRLVELPRHDLEDVASVLS